MTPIRISGKVLGQLALNDLCERCFWIRLRCQNRLPYQVFPGIFSSIDVYTKRVVAAHHEKYRRVPRWLEPFGELGEPVPIPHHSKFQTLDAATNILLTGVPDELFRRRDGTLVILDSKTARFTDAQDELLGLYRVQLNAYAYIARRIGLGKVSVLGLVYYEPQTDVNSGSINSVLCNDGFSMRFTAKLLPLPLKPKMIPGLLRQVRAIHDSTDAPEGRTGCKDCMLLSRLIEISEVWEHPRSGEVCARWR
jgi:hypothetical protein